MIGELTGPEKRKITREMGEQGRSRRQGSGIGSWWRQGVQRLGAGEPIVLETQLRNVADFNVLIPPKASAGPWTVAEQGRNAAFGPRMTGPRLTKHGKVSRAPEAVQRSPWQTDGVGRGQGNGDELPKVADREAVLRVVRKRFDVT
jgi:hypothetical protein